MKKAFANGSKAAPSTAKIFKYRPHTTPYTSQRSNAQGPLNVSQRPLEPVPSKTRRLHLDKNLDMRYTSAILLDAAQSIISYPFSPLLPLALHAHEKAFKAGFHLAIMTSSKKKLSAKSTIRRHVRSRVRQAFYEAALDHGYTFGALGDETQAPLDRIGNIKTSLDKSLRTNVGETRREIRQKVICGTIWLEPSLASYTSDYEELKRSVKKGLDKINSVPRDWDQETSLQPSKLLKHFDTWRQKFFRGRS